MVIVTESTARVAYDAITTLMDLALNLEAPVDTERGLEIASALAELDSQLDQNIDPQLTEVTRRVLSLVREANGTEEEESY